VVPPLDDAGESAVAAAPDESPDESPDRFRDSPDAGDSPDSWDRLRDSPDSDVGLWDSPDSSDDLRDSPGAPEDSDFEDPDEAVPDSTRREGALVARRSVFAQPVPLKWIVGGTNALATGPPHSGHWCGPASLIPRNTSKRWPQEPHT
jgi:hypothetical protein